MGDGNDFGDIAASSQSCIAAFKELLKHQSADLSDTVISIERNPTTITTGLPKNRRLSETDGSSNHGDLRNEGSLMQFPEAAVLSHEIEIAFARFKIWAGNLGVLQRGSNSLDVRLRESNVMRVAIFEILNSLRETLSECKLLPQS